MVLVLSLYYLRHSFGHYVVSALLTASVCHCIVFVIRTAFAWSLYCLCTTNGFRLVIVLSLCYLWFSLGPCIVSVLLTAFLWSLCFLCITYGFRLSLYCLCYTYAFVWSLYCLCTTNGFRLVIVLSLYYLWLSFGHCIVSVLLTAFVWSLYFLCTTYGFRLVIILSLYYLRL